MADTTIERINIDIQVTSQSAEQRIKRLEDALDALKRASEDATEGASAAASGVGHSASHAAHRISTLEKGLHKVRNAVLSVPKTALSTAFNAAIAPVKSLERSISSVHTRISSTFAALKRIAIYRLMRTMIKEFTQGLKEGIGNLYKWSEYVGTRFHSSMDSMATSALYIKNSLATIAEPILNVLAPAIEFLADRFAALAASIAEFLAALTGQDQYTIALRFPEKYGEEAEETAKAMQKWLGPFDEINRLSDPSKSGKDLDLDWTKMFETMTVEGTGPIGEFVKKLKEGFQAGDLTEIGQILGTKLQEAMDGINWPAIQEKARTIASSIGTFINGFFADTGFASSLGATIAEALNTAIEFFGTIADTLDFDGLGEALGTGMQSFFENFNFERFIGTITKFSTGFVTFLSKAIKKVKWDELGTKIGEAIKGINWTEAFGAVGELGSTVINSLIDFVSSFTGTGALEESLSALGETVAKFIKAINWTKAFETVGKIGSAVIKAMLDCVASLTDTKDNIIVKAAEGVGKLIGGIFRDAELWKKVFKAVRGLGKAFVQGLFGAMTGIISGITQKDIHFTLDDDSAEAVFTVLFAGMSVGKLGQFLMKVFGGGGGGGSQSTPTVTTTGGGSSEGGSSTGGGTRFIPTIAALIASLIVGTGGDSLKGKYEDTQGYLDWKSGLDSTQLSRLRQMWKEWEIAGKPGGRDADPMALAYEHFMGGGSTEDWLTQQGYGIGGQFEQHKQEIEDLALVLGSFGDVGVAVGEKLAPVGTIFEDIWKKIKKSGKSAEESEKQFPLMQKALERSAKGMGKASGQIDTHAVATRKKFNLMEKGLDNIKKKATGKNALGQTNFEKAAKNLRNSAKATTTRIASIGTGVKNLKNRLVTKNALGQTQFKNAAKTISDAADLDKKRIGDIPTQIDALKKKLKGENPLAENKFVEAAGKIKNSAKAAGDEIISKIGGSTSSVKATVKTNLNGIENDVNTWKGNVFNKMNAFNSGMLNGIDGTMSGFSDSVVDGLTVALQDYAYFAGESGRLMQQTASTYSTAGLVRYRNTGGGGGGGGGSHGGTSMYYANGGFVDTGEIFVAREAGPEMVGRFGNRNAVANNDQIVAGIAAGVSEANEDVVNAIYASINQVIGAIRENRSSNGTVDWDAVTRRITKTQYRQAASAFR